MLITFRPVLFLLTCVHDWKASHRAILLSYGCADLRHMVFNLLVPTVVLEYPRFPLSTPLTSQNHLRDPSGSPGALARRRSCDAIEAVENHFCTRASVAPLTGDNTIYID